MASYDFQIGWHVTEDHPEWGSAARGPLVRFDMAHAGEWMGSVIGKAPGTDKEMVYHVVRCEICIATHVWPLPTLEALSAYYAEQFYQIEKPDYLARYHKDRPWWEQCVHKPLITATEQLIPSRTGRRRMLEIGAGPGIALDVAAGMGWETTAIEPSPVCARELYQRGHMVWEGTLESLGMPYGIGESYDVIYAYEVAEHQPCPEDFFLRCHDLMAPGGVLVVAVPNDGNPLQYQVCERLKIAPYWYAPPQHLFYFTPKTLQLLVRRCGFDIQDMRGTYPMERFILDEQQYYLGNDVLGRRVHQWRMQDELLALEMGLWWGREEYYRRQLADHRIGREIYCIAQKPGGDGDGAPV